MEVLLGLARADVPDSVILFLDQSERPGLTALHRPLQFEIEVGEYMFQKLVELAGALWVLAHPGSWCPGRCLARADPGQCAGRPAAVHAGGTCRQGI